MSAKAEPRPCSRCPTITPRIIRGLCPKCYYHLRYTETSEHRAETTKRWQEANPERHRAARLRITLRKYHALSPEQRIAKSRDRTARMSEAEKQKRLQYQRDYFQSHRDARTALHQNRRAAKKSAPGVATAEQWRAIKAAYDQRCAYCGQRFERLTQDHVIPLSKGGRHEPSNIVPACRSCNSGKRDKLLDSPPSLRLMF